MCSVCYGREATVEVVQVLEEIDADRILREYTEIAARVQWENGQTSINYKEQDEDKHLGGCGWNQEYFTRGAAFQKDYTLYNDEYEHTLIKGVLQKYNCFRSRLLTRHSGTCYQWHNDDDYLRIHIPIISDHGNWFAFEEGLKRLDPGYVYLVNTTVDHSFFNGSKTDRIHVVGNTEYEFSD